MSTFPEYPAASTCAISCVTTLEYINSINEKPQIQLVSNSVNVNIEKEEFDDESRERIMNAVSQILALTEKPKEEIEYIDINAEEVETRT